MLFTEARFLIFFAVVFALHWLLRGNGPRKAMLLAASYVFYGAWDWRFLALIMFSTALDYGLGLAIAATEARGRRRALLAASLVTNLGFLGVFKYFNFFVSSGVSLLQALGMDVEPRTLEIILPVGISFYTFQSLSYTIDVYRRQIPVERSFSDFALFVAFFPQLVAGPIVRAADFLPQLKSTRSFTTVNVRACLVLFLVGYIKKACVSDHFAAPIDTVFAAPSGYGAADLWLATVMYTVRIYCDFSGYSDMAIATAGLLGYWLPKNFDFPYLARSITDFWRRWHISLSTWFRDYLYIPLGGSRGSRARTYRNLWIVFFLCGLWHGANWTFVVWGLFHGAFLVLERVLHKDPVGGRSLVLDHLYVLLVAMIGWVFFRAQSLPDAFTFLAGMLGLASPVSGADPIDPRWWIVVGGFAVVHVVMRRVRLDEVGQRTPDWAFAAAYGALVAGVMPFVAPDYEAFIYFQF